MLVLSGTPHCSSAVIHLKLLGVTTRLLNPSEVQVPHPMTYSQRFKTTIHRKRFPFFSFLYCPLSFCLLTSD